jgi:hypothetical protein
MVGYRNVSKGANRITYFERGGVIDEQLLVNLAEALGIDLPTVKNLIEQDRQEWEKWANEPVPMCLFVKYLPAFYGTIKVPDDVNTPEQAEKYACDYARQHKLQMCLAVSRRLSIWINRHGEVVSRTETTPDEPNVPYMWLKGHKRTFLWSFGGSEDGR